MAADADREGADAEALDRDPLDVLESVVRHLGDELALFRRRALDAERRLRDELARHAPVPSAGAPAAPPRAPADVERIAALEAENVELRGRLAEAAERARSVASRLRFARQQDDAAAVEGVA